MEGTLGVSRREQGELPQPRIGWSGGHEGLWLRYEQQAAVGLAAAEWIGIVWRKWHDIESPSCTLRECHCGISKTHTSTDPADTHRPLSMVEDTDIYH